MTRPDAAIVFAFLRRSRLDAEPDRVLQGVLAADAVLAACVAALAWWGW